MKYTTALFTLLLVSVLMGCDKWNTPESIEIDHVGGYFTIDNEESQAYWQNLRNWKANAINYSRPVFFGWFSNWNPNGPIRKGYLTALPDSVDIISMWSGTPSKEEITPAQKADKEFAQNVMGIKLLRVSLLSHIGKGHTPASVFDEVNQKAEAEGWDDRKREEETMYARWAYWGFTSRKFYSDDHYAALDKFAKAMADALEADEWDGFDIDWEPGAGFNDADGSLDSYTLTYLVKELGKYIGPKSDPDNKGHKLLCIDGEITSLSDELNEYVDYWILQSYGSSNPGFYAPGNDPRKVIITDNFESSATSGGVLTRQAAHMPRDNYKGGVGAYRLDNDYNNEPDYKWTRQAIQINQQVFQEWKDAQKSTSTEEETE